MSRLASLTSGILVILVSLLLFAPGAGADPRRPEDRGRSEDARDRSGTQRSSTDEDPEQEAGEEPAEEEAGSPGGDRGDDSEPAGDERGEPQATPGPSPDATPAREGLDVDVSASPAHVQPGQTSTVAIAATNSGGETIHSLELMAEIPGTLEFVSSDPSGTAEDDVVSFRLGTVSPGVTVHAELVVRGADVAGSQSPVRLALIADDEVFRYEVMVAVGPEGGGGLTLSQTGPLLVQVGGTEGFSLTVSNPTGGALTDVVVVAEIAPELDVAGVVPIEEADAIQLGSSASGEDIVWLFEEIEPGGSIEMMWSATAVAPGDLEATNFASVRAGGRDPVGSEQSTYLGFVESLEVESNEPPVPQLRRRVVTKMVPVSQVAASAGALLPVTGAAPIAVSALGLSLLALGLACMWLSSRRTSVRRPGVVALSALLLVGVACVSSPDPSSQSSQGARGSAAAERSDEVEDPAKPKDEVLGIRIEKEAPADGDWSPVQTPDAVPPPPVGLTETGIVLEEVVTVESVLVSPPALPTRTMTSRSSDNTLSIVWSPPRNLTSVSSRALTVDATEELLVSLEGAGSRLASVVTLTNLSDAERLAVRGRLTLDIAGESGSSTLRSERIDLVLEPGASVDADFTLALPAGTFSVTGGFLSD